jgi:hypothetical protein
MLQPEFTVPTTPLPRIHIRLGLRGHNRKEADEYIRDQSARFPHLIPFGDRSRTAGAVDHLWPTSYTNSSARSARATLPTRDGIDLDKPYARRPGGQGVVG